MVFVFLYGWCGLSVWQNRNRLGGLIDKDMLAAGGFFLAIVMIAPDMFMNTIFFGSRWFPIALIFLLLSLPVPSIRRPSGEDSRLNYRRRILLDNGLRLAQVRNRGTGRITGKPGPAPRLVPGP